MKNNYKGRDGNGYQPLPETPKNMPSEFDKLNGKTSSIIQSLFIAILLFVLMLGIFSFKANSSELCSGWASQAEKIMTVRQEHMSLAEISTRLDESKDIPEEARPIFTNLIAQAYQVPIYNKIQDKLDVIKEFSDNVLIDCLNKTAEKT